MHFQSGYCDLNCKINRFLGAWKLGCIGNVEVVILLQQMFTYFALITFANHKTLLEDDLSLNFHPSGKQD